MRVTTKLGLIAASGVLAFAVPATAKSPHQGDPHHASGRSSHDGSGSHRCSAHRIAYIAKGTIVSWSATAGSDGRYSGTVTVTVTHANHHAAGAVGTTVTYTLTNATVHLGNGASAPATGDRIELIGKITAVSHRCTDQTGAGTVTVRRVTVRLPIQQS